VQALLPFLNGFVLLGPHVLCNIQDNWIQKQALQFWQELVASTENMKNRLDQMEQSEPVTFVFSNSSLNISLIFLRLVGTETSSRRNSLQAR